MPCQRQGAQESTGSASRSSVAVNKPQRLRPRHDWRCQANPGACPRAGRRPDPGDGHTLDGAARQVERLTGTPIRAALRRSRLSGPQRPTQGPRVSSPANGRGPSRRRSARSCAAGSAIEAGHRSHERATAALGRKLPSSARSAMRSMRFLAGVGYNLRLILNWLRALFWLSLSLPPTLCSSSLPQNPNVSHRVAMKIPLFTADELAASWRFSIWLWFGELGPRNVVNAVHLLSPDSRTMPGPDDQRTRS